MIFSYELETQLLAGLIKYPGEYCKIAAVISDKDFYSESNKINKTIFLILKQALENAETINEVIISQRVKDLGISFEENINPSDYIESLAVKKIGADSVLATAKELKKFTIRRQIYERCVSVGKKMRGLSSAVPYQEIIDIVDKDFNDQINLYESNENEPENIFDTMEEVIEERGNSPVTDFGLKGPHSILHSLYGSLVRGGNISVVVARSAVGKELANYAKIKTPTGWTTHGEVKVGDKVSCPDGSISTVNGVFPQGKKDVYRVHFKDGRYIDAGLDHLWKVWAYGGYDEKRKMKWQVLDTKGIIKKLRNKGRTVSIPLVGKIDNEYKENLPIDPYVLGVLLGNGSLVKYDSPCISTPDNEIYEIVGKIYRCGKKRNETKTCFSFGVLEDSVFENLNKLQLNGTYCHTKFIPEIYKKASFEDRLSLIQGMMDTDGASNKPQPKKNGNLACGSLSLSTVSKQMALDFQEIVRSVGGTARIRMIEGRQDTIKTWTGKRKDIYLVYIRYPKPELMFRSQKTRSRFDGTYQFSDLKLKIVKVEKLDKQEECTCISIDHPDHLYITDNYIVTHNTQFAMDFTTKIAYEYNVPVLHFDNGEMSKSELLNRQCAAMACVPLSLIEKGTWRKAGKEIVDKVRSVWPRIKKMKFYYFNVGGTNVDAQINILKRFYYSKIGRGNQLILSFDYIKASSDGSFTSKQEHQVIGEMVDKYKRCIQKDLVFNNEPVVSMFTSVQANRSGIVGNKHSDELIEDEGVASLSDRIQHFCSHMFLLRNKTLDEIISYPNFGTHVLKNLKSRHLGDDVAGALNPVKMPDGSFKKNYLNFEFSNFGITEKGDLRDIVKSMEDHILAENEPDDIPKGL